ncbi:MAG TPA: tetratricopeptide repeat protein [Candidatus Polarisedimenticolia bacterium]
MTTLLCPMLTALKPTDDAGAPVNRECIYEQCRFFHLEKRDCSLMMASRAMLQMADDTTRAGAAGGAPPPDFERRLTDMGKDLLQSALEVQGVVREAAQANLERTASVETRLERLESALGQRLAGLEAAGQAAAAGVQAAAAAGERAATAAGDAEAQRAALAGIEERLQAMAADNAERLQALSAESADRLQAFASDSAERLSGFAAQGAERLQALQDRTEGHLQVLQARAEEHGKILFDLGAAAGQTAEQTTALSDLQQKVATRLLEEMSLVGANSHKVEQSLGGLEKKVDQAIQENAHLSQLVTLIKGETERTYAALRSIHEGNRAVIQAVETQLQRDQADLKHRRHEEAQSCNNRGVLSYYRGALEAALEAFRQAVTLEPEFAEAHNNLGLVHSRLGQDKEAVEAFQKALKLDPKMGEVYNNLGFLYHTTSQFERAVQMFGQAIQSTADSSVAYTNLGNTFYKMKQPEKAVEAWQRALELDPMNENARRGLRMFQQEPNPN